MSRGQGGAVHYYNSSKNEIVQFLCKLSRGGPPKHSSHLGQPCDFYLRGARAPARSATRRRPAASRHPAVEMP
jgi:hypothetical protein